MKPPERNETAGVLLLGVVLFALALNLRANQPGVLESTIPDLVWPLAAGVAYAVAAALMAGRTTRALVLFLLMAVAHTLDATLMGLAFAARGDVPPDLALGAVAEGLMRYPPAVALQVASVLPFAWLVFRRKAVPAGPVPGAQWLAAAQTPQQLLHAILSVETAQRDGVDPALAAVASRARALLLAAPRLAPPAAAPAPGEQLATPTEVDDAGGAG